MRHVTLLAVVAIAAVAPLAAAAPVPVVLAVDTSRSLGGADLSAAVEALREMVRRLPPDTPLGAIEFGDAARWLSRPDAGREATLRALGDLEPRGAFTLLNDALFETAKALPRGGVVVLASDGRDENSATTIEDVARICAANGVRIVTLGVGRRVDERSLRRLALLTDGAYVGRRPLAASANLLIAVEGARRATGEAQARAVPPPARPPLPAPSPVPTAAPVEAGVSIPPWIPVALALAAIAAATSILLWRRQRREERRVCERCGLPLEPWDDACPQCRAEAERADSDIRERHDRESLARAVARAPVTGSAEAAVALEPELLARSPLDEPVDKTFVFGEQFVIVVKEHRRVPRTFALSPDTPFTVGRAPKVNTVSIGDPTLSAQHFRVVFKQGAYYLADLETTNGTTVNGDRVRVHLLQPGDHIRAGEVDFEFRVRLTPSRQQAAAAEPS